MGILDAATNAVNTAKSVIGGGPATAVSAVNDAVSNVTGGLGSLSGIFSGASIVQPKPLPNVLSSYATYNYILGLAAITKHDYNFPDKSYMAGLGSRYIVCKSANADPNYRINTAYGKFDFFIESLRLDSTIGFADGRNSTITKIEFEVVEPYSALMFPLALQTGAYQAGWKNWRDSPFLLSIEFRGNKEDGSMQTIPKTNRYIPIRLVSMKIKTSERGTRYIVNAIVSNSQAKTTEFAQFKTDVQVRGKTIQEILQTGEQSLQAVVNQRLRELKEEKKLVADPDEILILFPNEIASDSTPVSNPNAPETKSSATVSTTAPRSSALFTKLGVSVGVNKTLVQPDGQCNEIGKAESGLDLFRKGKAPMSKPGAVYDEKGVNVVLGNVQADPKEGAYTFSQSQDITTAINEVILSSNYVDSALKASNMDSSGMRNWWKIDTQVYYKDADANMSKTGTASRLIVYRIIPYKAHSSAITANNVKAPGLDQITKNVVKTYDYIYTGKNTEVMKFDIDFSVSFSNILAADGGMSNIDDKRSAETGQQDKKQTESSGLADGNTPEKGQTPQSNKPIADELPSDNQGGTAPDTPAHRAARVFHNALTKNVDMVTLNMEIWGDPFWIPQSGMGNYTAAQGSRPGITKDGTVDYQRGQIDTYVNFRSPIDINQNTGMFDFGQNAKTGSVVEFSGLYTVINVTSTFRQGKFTQVLRGNRRPNYERKTTDTRDKTLATDLPDVSQESNVPSSESNTELRTPEEIQASKDLGNFMG